MRVPWLPTALAYDCGPACLAMILGYYGHESSVDDLRQRLGTGRDGTTGLELVRVARELGMEARGVRATDAGALTGARLPAIAHYSSGHFVVLERLRPGRSVRVLDPMRGRLDLPLSEFLREFSGVLILILPTSAFRPRRDRSWVRFLKDCLGGRGRLIATMIGLSLLIQSSAFALPVLVAFVVDRLIPGRSLPALGLAVLGIPVIVGIFTLVSWVRGRLMAFFSREVSRELLDRIFRHLLRLPLPFFHGRPVEDLISRVQGADYVLDEILDQVLGALLDTLLALSALIALLFLYPKMCILVIAAAGIQGVLSWFAQRVSLDEFIRDILSSARLLNFSAEALGSIADVKMIGVDRTEPVWTKFLEERVDARMRRKRRSALWDGLMIAAQMGTQLAVLMAGAALALAGAATVGTVVGFYSLAGVCLTPISALAAGIYRFRSTAEYLRRAYEVLSVRPEPTRPSGTPAPVASLRGLFQLRDVSFRYSPAGKDVLQGINLEIRPGEMVVIVGKTGSGKSTLARLLATLYEPVSGEFLLDGLPVDRYDLSEIRSRIGCVFQENVLAGGTVYENLTLGREIPPDDVWAALDLAVLRDEVETMPIILATPVGSGGMHLSGGQRQRLCLARALASRPAVMILDEATASVDRLTERRIFDNLASLHCTRILVTHRLYVAIHADRVIVLEEGRIVQSGRHAALLASPGPYAEMWSGLSEDMSDAAPGASAGPAPEARR